MSSFKNSENDSVYIAGTGSYIPEKIMTNNDLKKYVDTSDEWIVSRTGIKERRISEKNEYTSSMASKAGKIALKEAELKPENLDLIIVATITPDTLTPACACYVQKKLRAHKAIAFDISAACSGFLYALDIAKNMIENKSFKNALIIGAEKLSSFVNWKDRNTCVLFGDGAGAAVILPSSNNSKVLSSVLKTDGNYSDLLNIPGGGSSHPPELCIKDNSKFPPFLSMHGQEVFKHAVRLMTEACLNSLKEANLEIEDISMFIPHQANIRIIDAIMSKLKIPKEKVFTNLDRYGNTSAAAISIALDEVNKKGIIQRNDKILLVGFGAGFTWAGTIINW